jgi:hypothetical protein
MNNKILKILLIISFYSIICFSQSIDSYKTSEEQKSIGLSDNSKLSIHHSFSMGMSSFSGSSIQSQGLYSTLITYKFSKPLTLNLNFGFPVFSTFSPLQNLNVQNIKSADYFKNMPIQASMSWQPRENMYFNVSIIKLPESYYYYDKFLFFDNYYSPFYLNK